VRDISPGALVANPKVQLNTFWLACKYTDEVVVGCAAVYFPAG
jgi:hypothetical protein